MENREDWNEKYNKWINSTVLEDEDRKILLSMTEGECHEAFYKDIEFGTAGMRGKIGIGTNRLNRYTIRLAARGMAEYMGEGARVAIAYDTRHNSDAFAMEAARVMAAYGVKALVFKTYSPVPLLSFAVRYLNCDGGAVVTASHNTKAYNGFKTYNNLGIQMNPDATGEIFKYMKAVKDIFAIKLAAEDDENISYIDNYVAEAYNDALLSQSLYNDYEAKKNLNILYTPLFGSGRDYVKNALAKDGFTKLRILESQSVFDGDFPGLKKPNPEEAAVFSEAVKDANLHDTDIIIATDPDSDRFGAAVVTPQGIKYLSGNETGALFIDFISRMKSLNGKTLVTTIVTGDMGPDIAKAHGANVKRTLTGSKFVCGELQKLLKDEFLMGYEESYGYIMADHVRDKDGIAAAMFFSEMAAYHKAFGRNLVQVLDEIYDKMGYYINGQDSFVFEGHAGMDRMSRIMEQFRNFGREIFDGFAEIHKVHDYRKGIDGLPKSNVLKFIFSGGSWVAIRPSGTEPKIKVYYCVKAEKRENAEPLYEKIKEAIAVAIGDKG